MSAGLISCDYFEVWASFKGIDFDTENIYDKLIYEPKENSTNNIISNNAQRSL